MKFQQTDPDENYPLLKLVSENGRWEIGLTPVMFGVRVRGGLAGDGWCPIDYCGGDDRAFVGQLLAVMVQILETYPESISPGEISTLLPDYETKPISNDPCWKYLQEWRDRLVMEGAR